MLPLTVHHHPFATSTALTASLLTRYPTAHVPNPSPYASAFPAFPTHTKHLKPPPLRESAQTHADTASPTFTHTSSLYRSALPELAPAPGQQPKKAFIQLLTLSSRPNLTFVSSSFPLGDSGTTAASEVVAVGSTNDETPESKCSVGTIALQAGEQTRSFVMLLSTRLGGLWTVARGWDVVVEGRRWVITVPMSGDETANGVQRPSVAGTETDHGLSEFVEVEIGIGDVSLRGVAGSTREGQRGAVIFGNIVQGSLRSVGGQARGVAETSQRDKAEKALRDIIEAIKLDAGADGKWEVIQSEADGHEDEVQAWSRVLRSKASSQVPMVRSGSRQKN